RGAAVLLLTNARPEYRETWSAVRVRLAPLRPPDARTLVVELLGEHPALGSVHDLVLAKAEGNPFFMEEIAQALREEGVLEGDAAASVRVPASVQQVLAARIDRLAPPSKALLQTLAVLGRTAGVALAREVAGCCEEELAAGL